MLSLIVERWHATARPFWKKRHSPHAGFGQRLTPFGAVKAVVRSGLPKRKKSVNVLTVASQKKQWRRV
jgi:hypothetical protein